MIVAVEPKSEFYALLTVACGLDAKLKVLKHAPMLQAPATSVPDIIKRFKAGGLFASIP